MAKRRRKNPGDCDEEIVESMARTLWVSDWADRAEEAGESFSGTELMDVAPETTDAARLAAATLSGAYMNANKASMTDLLTRAALADKTEVDPEDFGHYLSMMALGSGVSWFDDHKKFPLKVPSFEAYDLDD